MTIQNLHRFLVSPQTENTDYQGMAKEQGVKQLVTAAKTEALHLSRVDGMMAPVAQFESNPEQALRDADALLKSEHVGENDTTAAVTRKQFIEDHKVGRTVEIISDNLTKVADGAEKELVRGIGNSFYTSDAVKEIQGEIQGLRDLAARNL